METKNTNALQKLSVSIINTFFVTILSLPFYYIFGFSTVFKVVLVVIFFLYNFSFIFLTKNRCLGMIILGIKWKEEYPIKIIDVLGDPYLLTEKDYTLYIRNLE